MVPRCDQYLCGVIANLVDCGMRYFIHIVTDIERIVDPDGQDFPALASARAEARQAARDLMAGELSAGRPVPFGWRVQVASADGTIAWTTRFAELVFGDAPMPVPSFAPVTNHKVMARAEATVARVL